jgi:hypothetical protein
MFGQRCRDKDAAGAKPAIGNHAGSFTQQIRRNAAIGDNYPCPAP